MLRSVCVVFTLFLSVMLFAQSNACTEVLRGKVVDEHDHSSLSFAEVFIASLERGAVCNEAGEFELTGLCPGNYALRVTHIGCEPVFLNVKIPYEKTLRVFLEHHAEELRIMQVQAERPDEQVGKVVNRITREEIDKAAGASLADLLEGVNGVNVLRSGPSIAKPVIHGLSGDRIVVVDRGIRQEDQQWGVDHAPNINPLTSGKISVVKGAASVEYGSGALGGVIISEALPIHDLDSVSAQLLVGAESNGRGALLNAIVQGPLSANKQLTWRMQAGGSFSGDRSAPDYVISNTGQRKFGGTVELGWKHKQKETHVAYRFDNTESGVMRSAHVGNLTDLQATLLSGEPRFEAPFTYEIDAPRQETQHHVLSVKTALTINETDRVVLTYGYQLNDRQEYDRRRGGRSARPSLDMLLTSHTLKAEHKHHLSERLHGKVGVEGMYQLNGNVQGTGVRPLIPYYELFSGGLFLIEHYELDEIELEGGLRIDQRNLLVQRFNENDEFEKPEQKLSNWAMNFGAAIPLKEHLTLRVNLASAFRAPNVSELYSQGLHHGSAAIEQGNDELSTEHSYKAIASVDFQNEEEKLKLGLSVYGDLIRDYIFLMPEGTRLTIQGAFPLFIYQAVDARLLGADFSAQYAINEHLTFSHSSSYIHGWDLSNNRALYRMPAPRMQNAIKYTRKWAKGALSTEVALNSVAQQTLFPEGVDFIDPPKAYQLTAIQCRFEKEKSAFGISVSNLFNVKYRELLDQFRYYSDALGTNVSLHYQTKF